MKAGKSTQVKAELRHIYVQISVLFNICIVVNTGHNGVAAAGRAQGFTETRVADVATIACTHQGKNKDKNKQIKKRGRISAVPTYPCRPCSPPRFPPFLKYF